jgi:hypothetical protein
MTKRSIRLILIIFSAFLVFANSFGQRGQEVGGYIGAAFYYGDLNTSLKIQKPGPAAGIFVKRNFNNRLSLRGGLNYARVAASDANSGNNFEKNRNLSFRSSILDFTGGLEFNFLPHDHGSSDAWYTPYLFAGLSVFYYNPTASLDGERYALRKLGTEGQELSQEYSVISGAFALGAGFKWDISHDVSVQTELTFRTLFTDYLDDVSTIYPDFGALADRHGQIAVDLSDRSLVDGIGIEGRQRGNSANNDNYVVISVGLTKYFGYIECPKISEW